jgi:hypothetical protein
MRNKNETDEKKVDVMLKKKIMKNYTDVASPDIPDIDKRNSRSRAVPDMRPGDNTALVSFPTGLFAAPFGSAACT